MKDLTAHFNYFFMFLNKRKICQIIMPNANACREMKNPENTVPLFSLTIAKIWEIIKNIAEFEASSESQRRVCTISIFQSKLHSYKNISWSQKLKCYRDKISGYNQQNGWEVIYVLQWFFLYNGNIF